MMHGKSQFPFRHPMPISGCAAAQCPFGVLACFLEKETVERPFLSNDKRPVKRRGCVGVRDKIVFTSWDETAFANP